MPEKFAFHDLDGIFADIVAAIVKGVGQDVRDYYKDNPDETHNALKLVRGDKINTNLRNFVVSDSVELKTFKRYSWEGRLIIDRQHKITITICTVQTLEAIPNKKNRTCPHYLMSILHVENSDVVPNYKQMSLFQNDDQFSDEVLDNDYKSIMDDDVTIEDCYKHLAIVYKTDGLNVSYIAARLLNPNFLTGCEYSLDKFLTPDFGDLTMDNNTTDSNKNDVSRLINVKTEAFTKDDKSRNEKLIGIKEQEEKNQA